MLSAPLSASKSCGDISVKKLLFPCLLLPSLASAETLSASPVNAGVLLQTLFGLLVVLGIIVLLGWLLKRSQYLHGAHHGQLKVLGAISLGTREKAVLLQVGEQQLVIGVTPHQVTTLYTLSEPLVPHDANTTTSAPFATRFRQALQQRGNN